MAPVQPKPGSRSPITAACSLQHGQQVRDASRRACWRRPGSTVKRHRPKAHLCCGSAGTYNILQPENRRPACATAKLAQRSSGLAPRGRRDRQHRLHDPARPGNPDPARPHGGASGLGDGRAEAEGFGIGAGSPATVLRCPPGLPAGLFRASPIAWPPTGLDLSPSSVARTGIRQGAADRCRKCHGGDVDSALHGR